MDACGGSTLEPAESLEPHRDAERLTVPISGRRERRRLGEIDGAFYRARIHKIAPIPPVRWMGLLGAQADEGACPPRCGARPDAPSKRQPTSPRPRAAPAPRSARPMARAVAAGVCRRVVVIRVVIPPPQPTTHGGVIHPGSRSGRGAVGAPPHPCPPRCTEKHERCARAPNVPR